MPAEPNAAATTSTDAPAGAFMGLGIASAQDPDDPGRTIVTRGENYRHIRHAEVLARWPVIGEAWARSVEAARLEAR